MGRRGLPSAASDGRARLRRRPAGYHPAAREVIRGHRGSLALRPACPGSPHRKGSCLTTAPQDRRSGRRYQPVIGHADAGAATATLTSTVAAASATCSARGRRARRTSIEEGLKGSPPPRSRGPEGARPAARRAPWSAPLLDAASRDDRHGPGWRHRWGNASNPFWPAPTTRGEVLRAPGPEVRQQGLCGRTDLFRTQRQPFAGVASAWLYGSDCGPNPEGTNQDNGRMRPA